MSSTAFTFSIVTPAKILYEGEVTSVTLPAADGYLGVWANHAPMVAAMRPGVLAFNDTTNPDRGVLYAVGSGFCEVSDNKLSVLVDSAVDAGEINFDELKADLARRKSELREHLNDAGFDNEAAEEEIALMEAKMKLGYTRGR